MRFWMAGCWRKSPGKEWKIMILPKANGTGRLWRQTGLLVVVRKEKEIAQSLGNSYYAFYRVNVRRNTYEIVKGSEYINARVPAHPWFRSPH